LLAIVRYNPAQMLGQMLGQEMARRTNRLNARVVATLTKHGRHADGGGLYLSISPNGGRRWVFLFRWHSKPTEIGLGSARDVTLARARELASQARAKLAEGINPKERYVR
jgi:beta-glucosidase-like glycosyl hydrolase